MREQDKNEVKQTTNGTNLWLNEKDVKFMNFFFYLRFLNFEFAIRVAINSRRIRAEVSHNRHLLQIYHSEVLVSALSMFDAQTYLHCNYWNMFLFLSQILALKQFRA